MTIISSAWSPTMMRRSSQNAQQVFCTTGDQGSEWIHGLDELPAPVRRRLADSHLNICPTCVDGDARYEARRRGLRRPTITVYYDVITAIERRLDGLPERRA
jgi:hypothetical protein